MVAAPAAAQQASGSDGQIVARVTFTRQQFLDLTDRMLAVAESLAEAEPDSAAVLQEAVRQARRAFIAEDMDRVAALLNEGMTGAAAATQSGVIEELSRLLALLQAGALDLDERAERLAEWRQQLAEIKKHLKDQQDLATATRLTLDAADLDARLTALADRLADILARQEAVRAATQHAAESADAALEQLGQLRDELRRLIVRQQNLIRSVDQVGFDRLPLVAELQRRLAESGESLQQELQAAADGATGPPETLRQAARHVGRAGEHMAEAAGALDIPRAQEAVDRQTDAAAELQAAEEMLSAMLRDAAAAGAAADLGRQQQTLTDEATQAGEELARLADAAQPGDRPGDVQAAAEEMQTAADDLADGRPSPAVPHQDEAMRLLRDQRVRLAQLRDRIKQTQRPPDEQADRQGGLAERTDRTARDMAGDADTPPTPAQSDVADAATDMYQAGEALGGDASQAGDAPSHQREAADKLRQARRTLAEAIAAEEQLQQTQRLAQIDRLLQQALDSQQGISATTREIYDAGQDDYDRPQRLKLAELSRGEGALAGDIRVVQTLLVEEGRSIVFRDVLGDLAGQFDLLETRLAERQAGPITQRVQEDVTIVLQEMIDAIRKELAERRAQASGGGGGGGGGGGQALLKPVAELKLLWRLQRQLATRTVELDRASPAMIDEQKKLRHQHLAEQQGRLQQMAQTLAEKVAAAKQAVEDADGTDPEEAQP